MSAENGPPPESENNPKELHKQRKLLKHRDDTQAWYESSFMVFFETALMAAPVIYGWSQGVPFEPLALLILAYIAAHTSSIWRCYVR